MAWSKKKKVYCVEAALSKTSLSEVRHRFVHHFQCKKVPSKNVIRVWIEKSGKYGTVNNLNPAHSGRKSSSRTEVIIETVEKSVAETPKKSL